MTTTFDTIVALVLVLAVSCGLWWCFGIGAKLVRFCRLTLKSLDWAKRNRRYMATWRT